MKFKVGHRYLVRFISMIASNVPISGAKEVKCVEVSPSGWVKLRLSNGEETWYSQEEQTKIMVIEDLGGDEGPVGWRSRIVNE